MQTEIKELERLGSTTEPIAGPIAGTTDLTPRPAAAAAGAAPAWPLPLSLRQQYWLYGTGALLLVTGVGWLIVAYFFPAHGLFGEEPNPSEPWWLRAHGAALIAFLIAFGSVLPAHAARGWRQHVNRYSGLTNIVTVLVLAITGYGLYYVSNDEVYTWVGTVHWIVGLLASVCLVVHVIRGRRQRARPSAPAPADLRVRRD